MNAKQYFMISSRVYGQMRFYDGQDWSSHPQFGRIYTSRQSADDSAQNIDEIYDYQIIARDFQVGPVVIVRYHGGFTYFGLTHLSDDDAEFVRYVIGSWGFMLGTWQAYTLADLGDIIRHHSETDKARAVAQKLHLINRKL